METGAEGGMRYPETVASLLRRLQSAGFICSACLRSDCTDIELTAKGRAAMDTLWEIDSGLGEVTHADAVLLFQLARWMRPGSGFERPDEKFPDG